VTDLPNGQAEVTELSEERAQSVINALKQNKIAIIQKELQQLLTKYNAGLQIRQVYINGMPQQAEIVVVLN
jgi:hypothetical protein